MHAHTAGTNVLPRGTAPTLRGRGTAGSFAEHTAWASTAASALSLLFPEVGGQTLLGKHQTVRCGNRSTGLPMLCNIVREKICCFCTILPIPSPKRSIKKPKCQCAEQRPRSSASPRPGDELTREQSCAPPCRRPRPRRRFIINLKSRQEFKMWILHVERRETNLNLH